jgi:hypothetical protein
MRSRWLVLAGFILVLISVAWVVVNRQSAITRSRSILVLDQSGQNLANELTKLEKFVHDHMRTSVSFELTGSYERAVEAAKAAAIPKVSSDIYRQAQAACPQKVATAQTKCIADYVASRTPRQTMPTVKLPSRDNFKRTYSAPDWTPDGAGLTLLLAIISWAVAGWLYLASKLWPKA